MDLSTSIYLVYMRLYIARLWNLFVRGITVCLIKNSFLFDTFPPRLQIQQACRYMRLWYREPHYSTRPFHWVWSLTIGWPLLIKVVRIDHYVKIVSCFSWSWLMTIKSFIQNDYLYDGLYHYWKEITLFLWHCLNFLVIFGLIFKYILMKIISQNGLFKYFLFMICLYDLMIFCLFVLFYARLFHNTLFYSH